MSDFTFTFHFHVLEKEMAAHSSVLAWRSPGMGLLFTEVRRLLNAVTSLVAEPRLQALADDETHFLFLSCSTSHL